MTESETRVIWKSADAVCFDVDSTVVTGEAIDELASFCGRGEEVAEWTRRAMRGGVSFREALENRLKIIQPSSKQLEEFIKSNKLELTPFVRNVIDCLLSHGTQVYLVSGGFQSILEPIAKDLGIPKTNVFANKILFNSNGDYCGFDKEAFTSSSGGKARVVQLLKDKYQYKRLVVIGDGVTDMEACPPADAFIGFGGNVVREQVKANAPWFVTDFKVLLDAL
ncbi:predicted protein [Nematostella vectensis]|uniref:Phosphoserine phosphatase n=1 Tax=Nematostella vectensis TaxID=45351 RepID=A7SA51_NEMVE|nr:predicted protein [Nematostella vectensis]|eukprot:XP_001631495.1 predicted protein [Nematostella vectensis]